MCDYRVFNETVLGHSHALRNLPLQDASASCSTDYEGQGIFYIAVTADGHGDPACTRSGTGAKMAVGVATKCLSDFAKEALKEPQKEGDIPICEKLLLAKPNWGGERSLARQSQIILKQLTDMIISRWYAMLEADIHTNPFSAQELAEAGIDAETYADTERRVCACAHAYGTTLLAALMLPDLLILIQQGDGRCEVYYEEGGNIVSDQPVPWDERCHDNFTTSLCDPDAAERIRFWVIDLREQPVAACYLGSDGVDDSFQEMMGTHMFYNRLSCDLPDLSPTKLAERLTSLSAEGSADDISVSGIYSPTLLRKYATVLRRQAERYELEQELSRYESRKSTMDRKHSILQKRMEKANTTLADWCNKVKQEQAKIQQKLDDLSKLIASYEKDLDEIREKIELGNQRLNATLRWPDPDAWPIFDIFSNEQNRVARLKEEERNLYQEYIQLKQKQAQVTRDSTQLEQKRQSYRKKLEQQANAAKEEFDTYDLDYQTVNNQIASLQNKINLLHSECLEPLPEVPACPQPEPAIKTAETPPPESDETTYSSSVKEQQDSIPEISPYSFPEFGAEE